MQLARFSLVAVLLVASCTTKSELPAQGTVAQRAAFEQAQHQRIAFEQRLLVAGGFEPLANVAASQRSVRQALFADPYMILPAYGIEVEQLLNGQVTVKIVGAERSSISMPLPSSAWDSLLETESGLFKPPQYVPWDPPPSDAPLPAPPPICHGWTVLMGATGSGVIGTSHWSECGSRRIQLGVSKPAGHNFIVKMADLAVSTQPLCIFDHENPFWSFHRCFSHLATPNPVNSGGD